LQNGVDIREVMNDARAQQAIGRVMRLPDFLAQKENQMA